MQRYHQSSSVIGVEITLSKKDLVSKNENRLSRPGGHFSGRWTEKMGSSDNVQNGQKRQYQFKQLSTI